LIRFLVALALLAGAAAAQPDGDAAEAVFLASGVRVGEVSATSAVVWTRTTAEPHRRSGQEISGRPVVTLAPGVDVSTLEGAVPGAPGEVRFTVRQRLDDGEARVVDWLPTVADRDFTRQILLDGLAADTPYAVTVEARPAAAPEAEATALETVTFRTAPGRDQQRPIRFAAMTCQYYGRRDRPDGFRIYPSMAAGRPDFYLSIGDNVYYDNGPGKTIWGTEQWRWLRDSLLASDADWKILVSPTPIVGPDRGNKADNHANAAFSHEGDAVREWFRANLDDSFLVVVGDRHWQYHSVHPETGLDEFSVGPASDAHAGGTPGEDPEYHRFHRVGGGFLSVDVDWVGDRPRIVLRHRDVSGRVVYEVERLRS